MENSVRDCIGFCVMCAMKGKKGKNKKQSGGSGNGSLDRRKQTDDGCGDEGNRDRIMEGVETLPDVNLRPGSQRGSTRSSSRGNRGCRPTSSEMQAQQQGNTAGHVLLNMSEQLELPTLQHADRAMTAPPDARSMAGLATNDTVEDSIAIGSWEGVQDHFPSRSSSRESDRDSHLSRMTWSRETS